VYVEKNWEASLSIEMGSYMGEVVNECVIIGTLRMENVPG
jgi:hypothetical protein